MKYRVELTATEKAEVDAAYQWLAEWSNRASLWLDRLLAAMEGLSEMPARCRLALESRHFREKIHQLLYGKKPHVYRVLFVVRRDVVYVLHVRHAARQAIEKEEVNFPSEEE